MRRAVLITGGSRGIGAAAVKLFAKAGDSVLFCYRENKSAADALVSSLSGFDVRAVRCDVSDITAVREMFNLTGSIDVLVNNAGISASGLFQDIESDVISGLYGTNLFGTLNCCRAVLPGMIGKKSGSIINVSSVWGEEGASLEVDYSVTKAAVIGLTKALAKELAPSGIRVNCVSPGVVDTDMNASLTERDRNALCSSIPLGRFGSAEEAAKVIFFLASEDASYIIGQNISVGGGFTG